MHSAMAGGDGERRDAAESNQAGNRAQSSPRMTERTSLRNSGKVAAGKPAVIAPRTSQTVLMLQWLRAETVGE